MLASLAKFRADLRLNKQHTPPTFQKVWATLSRKNHEMAPLQMMIDLLARTSSFVPENDIYYADCRADSIAGIYTICTLRVTGISTKIAECVFRGQKWCANISFSAFFNAPTLKHHPGRRCPTHHRLESIDHLLD